MNELQQLAEKLKDEVYLSLAEDNVHKDDFPDDPRDELIRNISKWQDEQ